MQKTPTAPELWDQALINGRTKHPSDGSSAATWAQEWYLENGGAYVEDAAIEVLVTPAPEACEVIKAEPEAEAEEAVVAAEEPKKVTKKKC
jgi:maltose-binding protein MalE